MENEWKLSRLNEKSQNFSIIVQELFFGRSSATTEFLLEEFQKLWVFLLWNWFARVGEGVLWARLRVSLRLTHIL